MSTTLAAAAPMVNHNTGSTVHEGGTDTITSAELDYDDAEQPDTAITYTVTSAVTNGRLLLGGVRLRVNDHFTQDDINNNRITYIHDGGEAATASFGFTVSDGQGGDVTDQTFTFKVTPVNDAPKISLPGNIDIVAAAVNGSSASVFLGDGTGGFTAGGPTQNGPAVSVALGDLNGDSHLDAVLTNPNTNELIVLLGDGLGGFTAAASVAVGASPRAVALGDLNGDGNLDAVVANTVDNTMSVLFGNGSGGFATGSTFATGTNPSAIALDDLDSDGDLDAVTANFGSGNVSVLVGNGSGGFTASAPVATGRNPSSVALGDIDGDGNLDALVTNYDSNNVTVLLGNGQIGGFTPIATYATGMGPGSVAMGDLDGDGDLDAVVANSVSNTMSVLLGNGRGGFIAATPVDTGANPFSVTLGDINHDGHLDAVVANRNSSNVSVLLGDGMGGFTAAAPLAASGPRSVALGDLNPSASTAEDTPLVFSNTNGNAITVSDAETGDLTVTLGVAHGNLTLAGTSALTVGGNDSGSVTLTGTQAAINNALDGLSYKPTANYNGADTLQVGINDNANGGAPAKTDSRSLAISVTPVSDAPSGTDKTVTIPQYGGYSFKAEDFGLSDVDGNTFQAVKITTAPTSGQLKHYTRGVLQAGDFISLADLNDNALQYVPDSYTGTSSASFTFQVQDNGSTANGGQNLDQSANTFTVNQADFTLATYTVGQVYNPANVTPVFNVVYRGPDVSYTLTVMPSSGKQWVTLTAGIPRGASSTQATLVPLIALNADFSTNRAAVNLSSGAGNDILRGGRGNDTLDGGAGNDILEGGTGTNTITGGEGTDTVTYENYRANAQFGTGVNVNLQTRSAMDQFSIGTTFQDTLNGIENVRGSAFFDVLRGGAGRNVMEGGGGGDGIVAGSGDGDGDASDFASYLHSASGVTVNLTTGVNTGGDAEGDVLNGIQNLYGSTHDDTLTGNGSANTIRGFGGADTISTGAGNDRVFISATPTLVDGGDDFDVLSIVVEGASTPAVDLTDQNFQNFERVIVYDGARVDMSGVSQGLLIRSASTAAGGANIYGTGGKDRIYGGAGNDVLRGGSGNDTIRAGEANQTIEGGTGNDLIFASTDTGANNPQNAFNMMMSGFGRDTIRGSADALSNDIFQVAGMASDFSQLSFAKYGNGAIVTGSGGQPGDGVFFSGLTVDQAKGLNFRFDQSA